MNNPFRFEPETFYMPSESEESFETFDTEYSGYNFEEETRRPNYRAQGSRSASRSPRGSRNMSSRRTGSRPQSFRQTSQLRKRQRDRRFPRPRFPSGVSFPAVIAQPYFPFPPQPPASPTNQQPPNSGGGSAPFPSDSGQSTPQGSEFTRWVQTTLNQALGLQLPVDGVMSVETRSAIRSFQQKNGLPVDGIVSPATERALTAAGSGGSSAGQGAAPPASGDEEPAAGEYGFGETFGFESEYEDWESEFNISGYPQSVVGLLQSKQEAAAVKLAITFGYRNENELTDLVFHARHPERGGRSLSSSEPDMVREWISIRDSVVRPALSGGAPAAPSAPPSTTTPSGPIDIVKVRGIPVARQIASQFESLLAAAEADGVRLGGGGFRTADEQIRLRRKNCGPTDYDIYKKSASKCSPPTAIPGTSNHERGLAIDFTYNGQGIETQSNPGFQWLAKNAARFGLYNYWKEPWHWSINGK